MEYLVFAIVFYFILRTMGNLVRLLGGDEDGSSEAGPTQEASSRPEGWKGPSPREETGTARDEPTFWDEDVEDATWRDLEDGSASTQNATR
jgi:hypothetical protein